LKSLKKILQQFYKQISYRLFHIIYGKINDVLPDDDSRINIQNIKIDKNSYKIFSLEKSRLYTDTIHDSALIIDNKIVDGPSFQLRNHINVNSIENIVFKRGTPKIKKIFKGKVLSLLIGGGGNYNYWHWLLDIIPRLKMVEKDIDNIDFFLLPNIEKKFQYETLELLEIPLNKTISSKRYNHIQADEIIVTSHPYNLTNNPWVDHLHIPSWIYKFLKEKFLHFARSDKLFPEKFYIDRNDTDSNNQYSRFIINEKEVRETLLNKGYKMIKLADLSFIDQVSLFKNAKSIVGLHGAGFANAIFCSQSAKILELKSETAGDIIKNLAMKNELIYNDITCKPKTINNFNQSGDIEVNIDLLNKMLKSI
tara:strand:- start:7260 stop:8357 length:1098 start_codon:yes stop_codon:yes gene_type:complete